ncbi:MAG: ATP-binding protein [Bacteroidota bacterium]
MEKNKYIDELLDKIKELEERLFDATTLMDAIKDGSIDAFVLNKEGRSDIYALESIDYTYRILIEKFGEGALSISQDGLILYCNFYFSELMNIPIGKIMGSYFQDYVSNTEDFKILLAQLKTGLSKGEIFLKTAGQEIPVYISLTSLQPYLPAIGMIVTDQTQNKKHESEIYLYQKELELKIKELDHMNRDLEQFVHIISHDIKEPLRKIISYGERLKKDLTGGLNESSIKNLNIICDATVRLNLLVDDLVQYSFSSRDKSGFKELDLTEIIKQVLNDIELAVDEHQAQIIFKDLPKIYGSEVQMRQLFSNLVINAIKYSKKNTAPVVNITSSYVSGFPEDPGKIYHKISVSDNGIGIEEQYLQKIFTIFQRLHSQSEYSGTGIGLAICKKIMENHDGRIDVESKLNKGSKFSLYLPVIKSP